MSKLLRSFGYAFAGMFAALKTEANWRLGIAGGILVVVAGIVLKISRTDWILVIVLIGLILSLELVNSSIEAVVDLITADRRPAAKRAKDFAAGASVILVIAAGVAGFLIFLPYLT